MLSVIVTVAELALIHLTQASSFLSDPGGLPWHLHTLGLTVNLE